jgi:hypothetical protein
MWSLLSTPPYVFKIPSLNYMNLVHALKTHYFKIYYNIVLEQGFPDFSNFKFQLRVYSVYVKVCTVFM